MSEKPTCRRCHSKKIATKGAPFFNYICLDCGLAWQTPEQAAQKKAQRKKRRKEDE